MSFISTVAASTWIKQMGFRNFHWVFLRDVAQNSHYITYLLFVFVTYFQTGVILISRQYPNLDAVFQAGSLDGLMSVKFRTNAWSPDTGFVYAHMSQRPFRPAVSECQLGEKDPWLRIVSNAIRSAESAGHLLRYVRFFVNYRRIPMSRGNCFDLVV